MVRARGTVKRLSHADDETGPRPTIATIGRSSCAGLIARELIRMSDKSLAVPPCPSCARRRRDPPIARVDSRRLNFYGAAEKLQSDKFD